MAVRIHIAATLRTCTGGNAVIETPPGTAAGVLESLFDSHPLLRAKLYTPSGAPRLFVRVFHGDGDLRESPASLVVRDGDDVTIMEGFAGG